MIIDYEYRLVTDSLMKLYKEDLASESILSKKIPKSAINSSVKCSSSYLEKAKDISGIYYRGLPMNSREHYLQQEYELTDAFNELKSTVSRDLDGFHVVQLPNPDFVSFTEFKDLVNNMSSVSAFELIPSWHGHRSTYDKYSPYIELVREMSLPLCLEVDHFFRKSKDDVAGFFALAEQYPTMMYWLPHFGCGIFLYWDRIMSILKHPPLLLSSVPKSLDWFEYFNSKACENIPIAFASDHPFNDGKSLELYSKWNEIKR